MCFIWWPLKRRVPGTTIGDRTGQGDPHFHYHWRSKRDSVSVSAAVRGTSRGNAVSFQSTFAASYPLQSVIFSST